MKTADVVVIEEVCLREGYTSLEGSFFRAMTERYPEVRTNLAESVRRVLEIKGAEGTVVFAKKVAWRFKSAACLQKPKVLDEEQLLAHQRALLIDEGMIYFNVCDESGQRGVFDHHGDEIAEGLSTLDLLRREGLVDYLETVPTLLELYLAISENDVFAKQISSGDDTIRSLMSNLICMEGMTDEKHLRLVTNAFIGAFAYKEKYPECSVGKALSVKGAIYGLQHAEMEAQSEELKSMWELAQRSAKRDYEQACKDVDRAIKLGNVDEVVHPRLSMFLERPIRILTVKSNAIKAGAATRRKELKRYDVVIILRSDRTCQIICNDMAEWEKLHPGRGSKDKPRLIRKWRFDFGQIATGLRLAEAAFSTPRQTLVRGEDWSAKGLIYDAAGKAVTWFLAAWGSLLAHQTLGSKSNIGGSKINDDKICRNVVENLPFCSLRRTADGKENENVFEAWGAKHYRPRTEKAKTPEKKDARERRPQGRQESKGSSNGNGHPKDGNHGRDDGLKHNMEIKPAETKE